MSSAVASDMLRVTVTYRQLPAQDIYTMFRLVPVFQVKRYFTGDLDAPVPGYPPYPGRERNLLRAQIARITSGVSVSPAGFFEINEEDEPMSLKVADDEAINEAFPKALEDLMVPDGWVHHEPELNALGRCDWCLVHAREATRVHQPATGCSSRSPDIMSCNDVKNISYTNSFH